MLNKIDNLHNINVRKLKYFRYFLKIINRKIEKKYWRNNVISRNKMEYCHQVKSFRGDENLGWSPIIVYNLIFFNKLYKHNKYSVII